MPELEKVIAGLESCRPGRNCGTCPYHEFFDKGICNRRLEDDALALLEAQMPRVMTLDEIVENREEAHIYLECPDVVGVTPVIYQPDAFEDGYLGFSGSWRNSGYDRGIACGKSG